MRTIGVVTVARSDYGIYLPVLRRIQEDKDLELHLFVAGTHLSPEFGLTVQAIEADGFKITDRIEMLLSSDSPHGIAKSMGLGTLGFAQTFARIHPDILLVLGDRFETHAAVVASLPFNIPVAHIHGGELTEGAIDDAIRHSITKLSHLHFVATEEYFKRVVQMGEEPWRVVLTGAPSLDNVLSMTLLSREELNARYGLEAGSSFLLVTYHPVTLECDQTENQVRELLAALEATDSAPVFTSPNADTNNRVILQMIQQYVANHPQARLVANLGTQVYFSMMKHATAMVGNSSSGIVEAASFRLPVVNIGTRQLGRIRSPNVIDVGYKSEEILQAILRASSQEFRSGLSNLVNPYGNGNAAERIVRTLKTAPLGNTILMKHFCDL